MPLLRSAVLASWQRFRRQVGTHATLLWAAAIGVIGAFATIAFREGIASLQWLLTGSQATLVDTARALAPPMRLLLPAAGGVVAGLLLEWSRRIDTGKRPSDYMEAIVIGDGRIPLRQSLLRSLSSIVTIATGGSIGREGSMIQLAALSASLAGRGLRFDAARLRLLVACGAAAGITSAYNAPIAGAVFITEIVLGSIAMASFGPVLVASVTANIVMREFAGYRPPYEMPAFPAVDGAQVLLFVLLGILAGMLAPRFLQLLDASRRQFRRLPLSLPLRMGIGGLIVGAISVAMPEVWGNGYEVVNDILHHDWPWTLLIAALLLKIAATAATAGSGAVGGVFTPTLFVGAMVGSLFGHAAVAIWPAASPAPFAYAIVGMGAFLAAAANAPLMAILMIFEMTLSYQVMLPLILGCVVAYFVAMASGEQSMYEITLRRNRTEQERLRLKTISVEELIRPTATVAGLNASVAELTALFMEHPVKYIYIVDDLQRYRGVVALKDITSGLLDTPDAQRRPAWEFLQHHLQPLTPDMLLDAALEQFLMHQGERLPAVKSMDDPVLLGAVTKTSLLDAYARLSGAA
ncbi:ClcB-like voltage-gated chloride channel protein [Noviherbaspirillum pedocola]|uniref:ClcB-like voltage-gated chloride channel protein n=1 Tax=Noviherbaspirillum pedocola TaxID=2801341 RepID=A0A934W3R1_9BURK|nr:ClcB-like voltage-gated chloride channel protein [Noviherbaspirillum pedocola]MBK4737711.1 ClcB-like voltage-gated chloride channel protein [Noviherbaspirillum pedocola]